jgi:prepilin-type N-terminal cleavage/methylation domain-containing protein
MKRRQRAQSGFTLIEVLVSVSIFAMVMLVSTGAVFSIVEANKKAHALKSVMTNLNFALESMARDIRVGSNYGCDTAIGVTGDCVAGGSTFHYTPNTALDPDDQIEYTLSSGRILKRIYGADASEAFITAQEIQIESMKFYALGTAGGDNRQPKLVLTIRGTAGQGTVRSEFNIQTTISQRAIDS